MTLLLLSSHQKHCERHERAPGSPALCGDQSNSELQSGNVGEAQDGMQAVLDYLGAHFSGRQQKS